jgi:hypothetical protein
MQRGFLEPNAASSELHEGDDKSAEDNISEEKLTIIFIHLRTMFLFFSHLLIGIDIYFTEF